MLFNYAVGNSLNKQNANVINHRFSKKTLLTFGVIANLALLGYFKYTDFLLENLNYAFGSNTEPLNLALPLAISFFTFQQISYLIDSYRQETKEYDFLNYALFVTFFPQLIAGPIVHHKEMMPQFANTRNKVKNYRNISMGFFIFSIGLFKKVVVADTFAVWATAGFDTATTLTFFEAWATSFSYTLQLYFDFSGYADMAIGLALLFNIRLPINFNSPYKSTSLIQFWQRWHMTLSRFVSAYIFKPILKSFTQHSFINAMLSVFISMVIMGLWHGASWMFVIFGIIHGLGIVINHICRKKIKLKIHKYIGWLMTINLVNFSLIFFRAKEWADAIKILESMLSLDNISLPRRLEDKLSFLNNYGVKFDGLTTNIADSNSIIAWLIGGFVFVLVFKNSSELASYPNLNDSKILTRKHSICLSLLFMFSLLWMSLSEYTEFIYFNF